MAGVEYPQNDFTRMIDRVTGDNRSGVSVRSSGVVSATPLPTAASADLGREVPAEEPLTPERIAELDQMARDAGIRDERLGNTGAEVPNTYMNLDAALAAGAPVNPPVVREAPSRGRPVVYPRVQAPRLPDFSKVQGINLISNVVMLDDMEFAITPVKAREFREFVIATARTAILAKLNEAKPRRKRRRATDGGSTAAASSAVQRESEGGSAEPTV